MAKFFIARTDDNHQPITKALRKFGIPRVVTGKCPTLKELDAFYVDTHAWGDGWGDLMVFVNQLTQPYFEIWEIKTYGGDLSKPERDMKAILWRNGVVHVIIRDAATAIQRIVNLRNGALK